MRPSPPVSLSSVSREACTVLSVILNSIVSLLCLRRCSSVGQPRVFSICSTLELLWWRFRQKRAARLWIISTFLVLLAVYGSQTVDAYSEIGLTIAVYARFLIFREPILRLPRRKPSIMLPLAQILLGGCPIRCCFGVSHQGT